MNKIQHSIRSKLLLAAGSGTALLVAAILAGMFLMWNALQTYQNQVEAMRAAERDVLELQLRFKTQVQEWKNVLLRGGDPAALNKYWGEFEKNEQEIQQAGSALRDRLQEPESRDLLDRFLNAHREMGTAYRKGLEAFKASNADAKAGDQAVKGIDRAPTALLGDTVKSIAGHADAVAHGAVTSGYDAVRYSLLAAGLAMLLATAGFVVMIQRQIVDPARNLAGQLAKLAQGDFTAPIHNGNHDEIGQLALSAEQVRQSLRAMVGSIEESSAAVSAAADELAVGADQVVNGSGSQSEAAASIASAVEELSHGIAEVAESTRHVRTLSEESGSLSGQSNDALSAFTEEMQRIAEIVRNSAHAIDRLGQEIGHISNIVSVISEVADQTNLLALNAAIEAARAGEQGRGFAVVADEVKKLAERTGASTREIGNVVQRIQESARESVAAMHGSAERFGEGLARVDQANAAMVQISGSVQNIALLINNIAHGIGEESAASQEIARNVENVAQMAEENTAISQATAGAARQMQSVAAGLHASVTRFRI
ncbi:MAG: methyl-accepting chemotaxis protein [Pseudomonadota bacterium]